MLINILLLVWLVLVHWHVDSFSIILQAVVMLNDEYSSLALFLHGGFLVYFPPKSVRQYLVRSSCCLFKHIHLVDMYSQAFSKDSTLIKVLVYSIYAIQTSQIVMFTDAGFKTFATGFGDLDSLDHIKTNWLSVCIIDGVGVSLITSLYKSCLTYLLSSGLRCTVILCVADLRHLRKTTTDSVDFFRQ